MNIPIRPHNHASGWFKSSASNPSQDCVEVRFNEGLVHVRDSKSYGLGPIITVSVQHWSGFLAEALGRAEAGSNRAIRIAYLADGGIRLHALDSDLVLSYTGSEWDAFVAGIAVGEFAYFPSRPAAPAHS